MRCPKCAKTYRSLFHGKLSRGKLVVGAAAAALVVRIAIYVIPQLGFLVREAIEHPQYMVGFVIPIGE
jgi:hypothetical protein